MYRIELSPGDETVFRSIEELAVAIKRGVVTPKARIYHNAGGTWLPIQFHPHYKIAASMELTNSALIAGPSVKPLSTLSLEAPSEPEVPAPILASVSDTAAKAASRKKGSSAGSAGKRSRRTTRPRRQLRIALVGALLLGGAQWVLSAPLFSGADVPAALIAAQRHVISSPTEAMRRVSSPNTAAMGPVLPQSGAPRPSYPGLTQPAGPSAPSFGGGAGPMESAAAEIQPPPGVDPLAPAGPPGDSLTATVVDSTNGKTLKRILQSVTSDSKPAVKR